MPSPRTEVVSRLRAEVERAASAWTDDLIPVLRRLIRHRYPPSVAFVEFEVSPDKQAFTLDFPVRAFFLDRDNTEVFEIVDGKPAYPSPVDPGLLKVRGIVSKDAWHRWETTCEAHGLDAWTLAAEALVPWFHSCWQAAGGSSSGLPAYVSVHDDPWTFDLKAGRWIDAATGEPLGTAWPRR